MYVHCKKSLFGIRQIPIWTMGRRTSAPKGGVWEGRLFHKSVLFSSAPPLSMSEFVFFYSVILSWYLPYCRLLSYIYSILSSIQHALLPIVMTRDFPLLNSTVWQCKYFRTDNRISTARDICRIKAIYPGCGLGIVLDFRYFCLPHPPTPSRPPAVGKELVYSSK
jgi:hypothetical protein